jgi:iron complex outermembrane recepter protein
MAITYWRASFFFSFFAPLLLLGQKADTSLLLKTIQIQSARVLPSSAVPHTDFDRLDIQKQADLRDIPYLLGKTPSVVETSDGGVGIGYTGFRLRGSDPTRINITVNGIPFNDAESQGVYWVNMPDIMASAQSIQVQRGVGASTNGSGSFGGSVHIDLNKIVAEREVKAVLGIGSFGSKAGSLAFESGLLKHGFYIGGRHSVTLTDGYVDRARAHLQSTHFKFGRVGERSSLVLHVLNGFEETYQAWNGLPQQYLRIEALRRFNTAGTEKPGAPYEDEVDHYQQTHFLLHHKYELRPNLIAQLNAHYTYGRGYYEQYKANQVRKDFGIPDEIDSSSMPITTFDLIRRLWLKNHFYGMTYQVKYTPNQSLHGLYGGGVHLYEGNHFGHVLWDSFQGYQRGPRTFYRNQAYKLDANQFVQIQWKLGRKTSLGVDMQGRFLEYTFEGRDNAGNLADQTVRYFFLNPKLSITQQIKQNLSFYSFVGIANREPNRNDFINSSPISRPKAERLYDLEIGIKHHSKKLNLQCNAFFMYYQNQLILNGQINDVGAFTRVNVDQSYRAGIEVEAGAQLSRRLTLNSSMAFSSNKVIDYQQFIDNWDDGTQTVTTYNSADLAYAPSFIATNQLEYQLLDQQHRVLSLTLANKFVSKQYLDNTNNAFAKLDPYSLFDLKLMYQLKQIWGKEIQISASALNLFNHQYESNGWTYRYISQQFDPSINDPYSIRRDDGQYQQTGYFPQAGRNYFLQAMVRF